MLCLFDSGSNWWIHVSCIITKRCRNPSGFSRCLARRPSQHVTLILFWSGVNMRGTHLADTLCRPNFSVSMAWIRVDEMPVTSSKYRMVRRRSAMTRSWILLIFSGVLTSTGLPLRAPSSQDSLPHPNSRHYFLTVLYDGADSSNVFCRSVWISVGVIFFILRYLITAQTS